MLEPDQVQQSPNLTEASPSCSGTLHAACAVRKASAASAPKMPDLVLKDVHVGHTEEQVASLLAGLIICRTLWIRYCSLVAR